MSDEVKPRRRYDSRRRQAQAGQTRDDILAAAQTMFLEHGYTGTTLAAVAQAAGVVVETIYRGFGGKPGLLRAVVEAAVAGAGARAQIPVEQRPAVRAVADDPDPRSQLQRYAATQPGIHARIGPLMRVLAAAATADADLAQVLHEMEERRLSGMGRLAQSLTDKGGLRPDLTPDEARDLLWTLNSHAVYDQLVNQRGWTPERYQTWLTETLIQSLVRPSGPPSNNPKK